MSQAVDTAAAKPGAPEGAPEPQATLPAWEQFGAAWLRIVERSQRLVQEHLSRQARDAADAPLDPFGIGEAFVAMTQRMLTDPGRLAALQVAFVEQSLQLWQYTARRLLGEPADPPLSSDPADKRFRDKAWTENAIFDYIKHSYLLAARTVYQAVRGVDGLDETISRKVDFYTRQFVDAMAPSNFALTNPEVLRATLESGGENLIRGLENLLTDLERGQGILRIRMTDERQFEVGRNLATSPGKVVLQNELMQLIQYSPTTEKVHKRPVVILPPWINKFYIMDLKPENSMVRWLVEQGHTVFMVSWVNPDARLALRNFDDYVALGFDAALDAALTITGADSANIAGYCIGGTLLAASLAAHTRRGTGARIRSATFLTALTDFTDAGEVKVFIDENQIAMLEGKMARQGFLDAESLHTTFNLLRVNDLFWNFFINNYLMGKDPLPFDLLYWNGDTTRMPAVMHSFYLREMYQQNRLAQPDALSIAGVPIDLTRIKTPAFIMAAREDHIAPWRSVYRLTHMLQGPIQFVLAASGHIAGTINPPAAAKYSHWTSNALPAKAEAWLAEATQAKGSWWPSWGVWLARHGGAKVAARQPGAGPFPALEDAPGSYVKVRAL